ncbi:MAG: glycosyltransferase family 4 protein [Candidatus Omnitrophica bacterium]|nr:glycosyltransferase family 4 protein [Candidatus Omnitrophota bacterium]
MNITITSLWAQKLFRPGEPQPFGGAELQLTLLARELAEQTDATIRFVTRGQGPAEEFLSGLLRIHKLPYRRLRIARSVWGMLDCLRACRRLPSDIYIQRGGGFETGITGWAARSKNKPFLFMTSSLWDVDGFHETRRGVLYGTFYLYGLRRAGIIITQTEQQQRLLKERYGRESIVMRSAHPIPEAIPEGKEGVLWVGRCEPCKDPDMFLELARRTPRISFTMVCPPANRMDMFERVQEKARVIANLRFLPGVSFEETERLFASHKVMVNTSTQEGYPNTFVQAFKWGLPIITARFDPDDILTAHGMGLRTGEAIEDLAKGVEAMMEEERWLEASRKARRFADEHHNIRTAASRFYEIIERAVAGHQKRAMAKHS